MMRRHRTRDPITRLANLASFAFVLALLAVVALAAFAAASVSAAPVAQSESDMERLKMLSGKEFELEFMSMMIAHHQSATEMSMLAADRANRQEIKDIAQKIITDQSREIGQMTEWLQQWHGATPMAGMMSGNMEMMARLSALRGDAFDREFLMMMREHHSSAIAMAQLVPERTTRQELRTLAQNIVTAQQAEIEQFMEWAMAWYNLDLMAGMSAPVGMPRTGEPGDGVGRLYLVLALVGASALALFGGLRLLGKSRSTSF